MLARVRRHLTYANVASSLALFIALSGGVAFAVTRLDPNSVRSKHIVNGQVKGADVNEGKLDATPLRTRAAQGNCKPTVPGTGQMVKVGPTCIDKYEASLWTAPNGGTQLIDSAAIIAACPHNGQPDGAADCEDFYARSVAGVVPQGDVSLVPGTAGPRQLG